MAKKRKFRKKARPQREPGPMPGLGQIEDKDRRAERKLEREIAVESAYELGEQILGPWRKS